MYNDVTLAIEIPQFYKVNKKKQVLNKYGGRITWLSHSV